MKQKEIVKDLIELGADVNVKTKDGDSAADIAASVNDKEVRKGKEWMVMCSLWGIWWRKECR